MIHSLMIGVCVLRTMGMVSQNDRHPQFIVALKEKGGKGLALISLAAHPHVLRTLSLLYKTHSFKERQELGFPASKAFPEGNFPKSS